MSSQVAKLSSDVADIIDRNIINLHLESPEHKALMTQIRKQSTKKKYSHNKLSDYDLTYMQNDNLPVLTYEHNVLTDSNYAIQMRNVDVNTMQLFADANF
jgi:hypothetical protein